MTLQELQDRKLHLEQSLNNIQQSFHIVTGHINEVNFQIQRIIDCPITIEEQVESIVE